MTLKILQKSPKGLPKKIRIPKIWSKIQICVSIQYCNNPDIVSLKHIVEQNMFGWNFGILDFSCSDNIQFLTRNLIFRSKITNPSVQGPKIRKNCLRRSISDFAFQFFCFFIGSSGEKALWRPLKGQNKPPPGLRGIASTQTVLPSSLCSMPGSMELARNNTAETHCGVFNPNYLLKHIQKDKIKTSVKICVRGMFS